MAIPDTTELMLPILKILVDGKEYRIRALVAKLADVLELSDEELKELTPGGSQAKFYSRVTGARSYLTQAKLLGSPRRGVSRITERGIAVLEDPPEQLDLPYLAQYPEFLDYLMTSRTAAKDPELRELIKLLQAEAEAVQEENDNEAEQDDTYVTTNELVKILASLAPSAANESDENAKEEEIDLQTVTGITVKRNPDAFKKQPVNITLMALLRIIETYFQHPWLYVSPLIVLAIACGLYFYLEQPPYVSEGIISVQSDTLIENVAGIDSGGFSWVTPAQATSDEFGELLQTDAFIRLIVQQTPLEANMDDGEAAIEETLKDARDAIQVFTLGSNQIKITAQYREPNIAHKLAEGAVNAFIQWKIDSDKQDSTSARIFLENLIPEYEADYNSGIEALEGYLLQHPEPLRGNRPALEALQIERLQTEVSQSYDRFITAQSNLEQIRLQEVIAEGTTLQTYTIVDHPQLPRNPEISLTDVVTVVAIFTAVGITLTVVGIIGNSVIDRSIRLAIDARYVTDMEVLAIIPAPYQVPMSRRERRKLRQKEKAAEKVETAEQTAVDTPPASEDTPLATTGD